jgi:uncharacterized protein
MKRFYLLLSLISFVSPVYPQIQTTTMPEPGYDTRIKKAVADIKVIDTHEHLETEERRIEQKNLDFSHLFRQYAIEDLISASNLHGFISVIFSDHFSLKDRWELFKPFFQVMRTTGYGRAPLIAANDLFDLPDINDDTFVALSQKIKVAGKPGYYRYVLKKRAGIDLSIQDAGHQKFDREFYRHVERFDNYIFIFGKDEINNAGAQQNVNIQTLNDFVLALRHAFEKGLDYQMVGVKSGLAYNRILNYANVSEKKASAVFDNILNRDDALPRPDFNEVKPLQDYMMHRVLDLAQEFNLPVQIHTGLHAGNGNTITNSKPTHLVNLFMEYPDVNFCIFHSSYPYGGELSTLAKNFPNVFIDMCWSAIISPSYSKRYLHEWIETVPSNKIMAFGGDYGVVECVYAHSVMARRIVAEVLIEKVADGYMTEQEAIRVAQRVLRENAMEVFKINGKSRGIAYLDVLQKPGFLHDWWQLHKSAEGLVRNWQVIGPFAYGTGLEEIYPPEKELKFDSVYNSANGQLKWQKMNIDESGYLDFLQAFYEHPQDNPADLAAIGYAYVSVESPDDRKVKLTLGSNDGAKVWVNKTVIYNEHVGRGAVADQVFLEADLQKGLNHILVKVENLGSKWGLYFRLVDPDKELLIKE